MPKMTIIKSIRVMRSAQEVFPLVHDFHNWIHWSPWHILDDANNYKVKDDGTFYEWESKLLGAGQMQRLNVVPNQIVESDLVFLKPWKSKSKIIFRVKELAQNECEVTWEMHGNMPFFMFFLVKMMERMVGMDFDRGLHLLKDFAEHGSNRCHLRIMGQESIASQNYIGISVKCTFDELGDKNKAGFEELMGFVSAENMELTGPPATIYKAFNFRKNQVEFTVAAPVSSKPANLKPNMTYAAFQGGKCHGVELKGPYHHLGTAWAAQSMRQRGKVFAGDKNRHAIEVYLNSPLDTLENELLTRIYLPMK